MSPSITPPSTPSPSQPLTPTLRPLSDAASLPAPPLQLPPSPVVMSSSSSSSSSIESTTFPLPLTSQQPLPRITITHNDRTIPTSLPWRPCYIAKPRHNRSYLAPPNFVQAKNIRHRHRQRQWQLQQQQQQHEAEVLDEWQPQAQAQWQAEDEEEEEEEDDDDVAPLENNPGLTRSLPTANYGSLVPIARELVRWQLLSFYGLVCGGEATAGATTAVEEEREALTTILLATPIDWQHTWAVLQAQRARYRARVRRTLGLLPRRWMLRGLDVLKWVRRAAADSGVGKEQLMLAVEAFAGRVNIKGFVEMKEWERLAGVLLMDRGEDAGRWVGGEGEWEGEWEGVCKREEAVMRYFSVLEYEVGCSVLALCCFRSCGKKRVVYRLSEVENAWLDGSLELQVQLVHAASSLRSASRQGESETGMPASEEHAPEPKTRRKSVRISVDEVQERTSSANRASWDSEEERQKRRRERREFIFGKEDEREDEIGDDEEIDDKRKEQERKRRQSVEKVMAANMKWNHGYVQD